MFIHAPIHLLLHALDSNLLNHSFNQLWQGFNSLRARYQCLLQSRHHKGCIMLLFQQASRLRAEVRSTAFLHTFFHLTLARLGHLLCAWYQRLLQSRHDKGCIVLLFQQASRLRAEVWALIQISRNDNIQRKSVVDDPEIRIRQDVQDFCQRGRSFCPRACKPSNPGHPSSSKTRTSKSFLIRKFVSTLDCKTQHSSIFVQVPTFVESIHNMYVRIVQKAFCFN
jgi:hypothetical protein